MQVPAHNPTTTPVAIDGDGRSLGGGEWALVDGDDAAVESAVADQRLVTFPDGFPDGAEIDPAIKAQLYPEPAADADASPSDRPRASADPPVSSADPPEVPKAATRKRSAS